MKGGSKGWESKGCVGEGEGGILCIVFQWVGQWVGGRCGLHKVKASVEGGFL